MKRESRLIKVLACAGLCLGNVLAGEKHLQNGDLKVTLDDKFPCVIEYRHKSGAVLDGEKRGNGTLLFNGKKTAFDVIFKRLAKNRAVYKLSFPDKKVKAELDVQIYNSTLTMTLGSVREEGKVKLASLSFADNALLSISTAAAGPQVAYTVASVKPTFRAHGIAGLVLNNEYKEQIQPLNKLKPEQRTSNYFFLSANGLAAGIGSNHFDDSKRAEFQIVKEGEEQSCRAWGTEFAYRGNDGKKVDKPFVKVFIADDINGDEKSDWQDAAVLFRRGMPKPFGAGFNSTLPGANIAMNFASGAQQPFLKILDEVKKIHRATDGIGNKVIIKGFSSEGHDSANTDYCDHFNARAGGLKDFNVLLEEANKYNSKIGIHINISEVYPEAKRYNPKTLMYTKKGERQKGWIWLDRSYYIDKDKDLMEGDLLNSLDKMKGQIPGLDFVYVDKGHFRGWSSWKAVRKLNELGYPVFVESPISFEPWAVWSHHRSKHHKSKVMNFIWYSDRELFVNDELLRGGRSDADGFMGWQNRHNFNSFIHGTFSRNLPACYLKNFELLHWEEGKSATFTRGVKVTKNDKLVTVSRNGRKVMSWEDGGKQSRLFVPWNPLTEEKIYLWDETGQEARWELPESWKGLSKVYFYKLTDQGRVEEKVLIVQSNKVSVIPQKNTPYVIYKSKAPKQSEYDWSTGSLVKDNGFDSNGFKEWKVKEGKAVIENDHLRNARLVIKSPEKSVVSQKVSGLQPGQAYTAYVWTQVKGKRTSRLQIKTGNTVVSNYVEQTNIRHGMPNDPRKGSRYQRIVATFTVPEGTTEAELSLIAEKGDNNSMIEFDDVRIAETSIPAKASKHWFYEDFESTAIGGYGPFTCCFGERTHLSETNRPYTDDTINGNYSLKTRDRGRVARTIPATLRFKPNTRYHLTCETLAVKGGKGRLAFEGGGKIITQEEIKEGRGKIVMEFTSDNTGDCFLSLFKDKGDWVVIDDLTIDIME